MLSLGISTDNQMDSIFLSSVFSPEEIHSLAVYCRAIQQTDAVNIDNGFGRKCRHNDPIFDGLHDKLVYLASYLAGKPLRRSYNFLALYQAGNGIVPPHTDRPQCEYNMGICIDSNFKWPMIIGRDSMIIGPGEGVFYSGFIPHSRPQMNDDEYATMILFHFVDKNFKGSID